MRCQRVLSVTILTGTSALTFATNFGAIAYDHASGSWGASYDHPSQKGANADALRSCPGKCIVVVEYYATCASYAVGRGTSSGFGYNNNELAAQSRALADCNNGGEKCRSIVTACNTAQRTYVGGGKRFTIEPRPSNSCWYRSGGRVPG
jgi:hypothetical protein